MFKVDLATAFFIYLVFTLIIVIVSSLILRYKRGKSEKPASLKKRVYRCPICTYVYMGDVDYDISQCPRCKSFNEQKD